MRAYVSDRFTVVKIAGKIFDGDSIWRYRKTTDRRELRLDFRRVELVTAGGLGRLLKLHKRLRSQLTIVNVRPLVYEVFEVTQLTSVLHVSCLTSRPDPVSVP